MTWLQPEENNTSASVANKQVKEVEEMPTLPVGEEAQITENTTPQLEEKKPQEKIEDDDEKIVTPDLMFDDIDSLFQ